MKAFPLSNMAGLNQSGMDLRDYFAAKVMQGLLASDVRASMAEFVENAYAAADAMMEARKL